MANPRDKIVKFGALRVGQTVKKSIPIVNNSPAPITFHLGITPSSTLLQDKNILKLTPTQEITLQVRKQTFILHSWKLSSTGLCVEQVQWISFCMKQSFPQIYCVNRWETNCILLMELCLYALYISQYVYFFSQEEDQPRLTLYSVRNVGYLNSQKRWVRSLYYT